MTSDPMTSVRDAGEVLRLLKEAAEFAKSLRTWFGTAKKGDDDALRMRDVAINLEERVMDLREQAIDLRDELIHVKQQNQELRADAVRREGWSAIRAKLRPQASPGNGYVAEEEISGYGKGPFCITCAETSMRLVPMTYALGEAVGPITCPVCVQGSRSRR